MTSAVTGTRMEIGWNLSPSWNPSHLGSFIEYVTSRPGLVKIFIALVVKHGLLENPPPFRVWDFPAGHVWWLHGIYRPKKPLVCRWVLWHFMTRPCHFRSLSVESSLRTGGGRPWRVSTSAFSGSAKENISGFEEIEDNLIPTGLSIWPWLASRVAQISKFPSLCVCRILQMPELGAEELKALETSRHWNLEGSRVEITN